MSTALKTKYQTFLNSVCALTVGTELFEDKFESWNDTTCNVLIMVWMMAKFAAFVTFRGQQRQKQININCASNAKWQV